MMNTTDSKSSKSSTSLSTYQTMSLGLIDSDTLDGIDDVLSILEMREESNGNSTSSNLETSSDDTVDSGEARLTSWLTEGLEESKHDEVNNF